MRTSILIIIFFSFSSGMSQENQERLGIKDIHDRIQRINKEPLYHRYIPAELCGGNESLPEASFDFWFDTAGRLRKLSVLHHELKGCDSILSSTGYIEYFDDDGLLMFHFFRYKNQERRKPRSAWGNLYFDQEEILREDIFGDKGILKLSGVAACVNDHYPSHCLHKNVDEVTSHFDLDPIFFKFDMDTNKGSRVLINSTTDLRSHPNVQSDLVGVLDPFTRVRILEKGPKQQFDKWGEHHWYRIEGPNVGWVFGAFLEPITK